MADGCIFCDTDSGRVPLVERLSLHPSETLVVSCDQGLTQVYADTIRDAIARALDLDGHRILIIDGGARLTVVGQDELPSG
jgi:hypothetical protein